MSLFMMDNSHYLLICTILLTVLALSIRNADSTTIKLADTDGWCVAKANAPAKQLKEFIDEKCLPDRQGPLALDCGTISPGGECYKPNTLRDHASYVLNLYYKSRGECKADIGLIVHKDPSTKSCNYP